MLVRYKKAGCASNLVGSFSKPSFNKTVRGLLFKSVKIIPLKSYNCALTLRKWLFCNAKQPLLSCKTYTFGMQNNRFCNMLITRLLGSSCACDNSLHFYASLSVYKTSSESK